MTAMTTNGVLDAAIGHEHADLYRSCLFCIMQVGGFLFWYKHDARHLQDPESLFLNVQVALKFVSRLQAQGQLTETATSTVIGEALSCIVYRGRST